MCLERLQNISLYLAENGFKTAAKYQLISGRKCVQNCCKIEVQIWQKMCLELLKNISLYLAENVFRTAVKYQLVYLAENVFGTAVKYQLVFGRKCIQNCCKISTHI